MVRGSCYDICLYMIEIAAPACLTVFSSNLHDSRIRKVAYQIEGVLNFGDF